MLYRIKKRTVILLYFIFVSIIVCFSSKFVDNIFRQQQFQAMKSLAVLCLAYSSFLKFISVYSFKKNSGRQLVSFYSYHELNNSRICTIWRPQIYFFLTLNLLFKRLLLKLREFYFIVFPVFLNTWAITHRTAEREHVVRLTDISLIPIENVLKSQVCNMKKSLLVQFIFYNERILKRWDFIIKTITLYYIHKPNSR